MLQPVVGIKFRDGLGRDTTRLYEARSAAISDAEAVAHANVLAAITKLGVVEVWVSRPVAYTPGTAEVGSHITSTAWLRTRKVNGGSYTFNLPEPIDALIQTGGGLLIDDPLFQALTEQFDDGAGLAGVAGTFFVSDGEELVEANAPLGITAVIDGAMHKK